MIESRSSSIEQKFIKRIYSVSTFKSAIEDVFAHLDDLRAASRGNIVDKQFSERIMLAVTQVNGCRYCSYGHSKAALAAGLSQTEINEMLAGEFVSAPEDQLTALAFAEHYAESGGSPESAAEEKMVSTYGEEGKSHITAYIRMIMMGNLMGNTFDAFLSRFKGKPAAGSNIWQELGVLLGSLVIIPAAMIRRAFSQKHGRS